MPAPVLTYSTKASVLRTRQSSRVTSILTMPVTVQSGSNFLLFSFSAGVADASTQAGPTFNGIGMTGYWAWTVPSTYYYRKVYYMVNPPVGTYNLSINWGLQYNYAIGGIASVYSGVDTTSPIVNHVQGNWTGYATACSIVSDPNYYLYAQVTSQGESGFDNKTTSCNYTNFGQELRGFENSTQSYSRHIWIAAGGKTGAVGSNTVTWSNPSGVSGSNPFWHLINIRGASAARSQVIWFM